MKHLSLSLFLICLAKIVQCTCEGKYVNHWAKWFQGDSWQDRSFIGSTHSEIRGKAYNLLGLQEGCSCGQLQCLWSWREAHRLWKDYQNGPAAGAASQIYGTQGVRDQHQQDKCIGRMPGAGPFPAHSCLPRKKGWVWMRTVHSCQGFVMFWVQVISGVLN